MIATLILPIIFPFSGILGINLKYPPIGLQSEDTQLIGGAQMLNAFLERRSVLFNGKLTSLREIYGDVQPTATNFRMGRILLLAGMHDTQVISFPPPDVGKYCAADTYVERELIHSRPGSSDTIKATPSAIAAEIVANRGTAAPQLTVISGDSRSGKSVTLKKIQYDVVTADATTWTVYVDMTLIFRTFTLPFDVINHELILSRIIDLDVPQRHQVFFRNVLEVNPKKVLFLLDCVDQIVGASAKSVAMILKGFFNAGTPAVVTGSYLTVEILNELELNFNQFHLTEMNFREMRNFMRNLWGKSLSLTLYGRPTLVSATETAQRLEDYTTAFAALIQQTQLPRTPQPLRILGALFEDRQISGSCLNYVLNPSGSTTPRIIQNVMLDKTLIYDAFVNILREQKMINDIPRVLYGALALAQIVREVETPRIASALINIFQTDVQRAEQRLRSRAQHYVFVNVVGDKMEFIHPEFRNYFAAQYTSTMFDANENVEFFVRRILRQPHYARVTEFLDFFPPNFLRSRSSVSPFTRRNKSEFFAMLDNFLVQGFSILFLRSVEELIERNSLSELVPYITDSTRVLLANYPKPFGIKNAGQSTMPHEEVHLFTRLELLMERGILGVYHRLVNIDRAVRLPPEEYQNLAMRAVTSPYISPSLCLVVLSIGPGFQFHLDFDRLLYEAINANEAMSQAKAIVVAQYVLDAPAIRVNGESLLHAAARSSDVEIVRYVMNTLQVPLVQEGQVDVRVLELALDSNPTSLFTPDGWWEKIWLLVDQIGSTPIARHQHRDLSDLNFEIPRRDFHAEWFKFMLGGQPETIEENYDVRAVTVRPLDAVEVEQNVALMQLRPTSAWGLSPQTLSLRRKFLVTKLRQYNPQVSFAEMMVHYRGGRPLNADDRVMYRSTIRMLLRWERFELTREDRLRIFDALVDNIIDVDDFHDLRFIAQHGLLTNNGEELTEENYRRILQRMTRPRVSQDDGTVSVAGQLLRQGAHIPRSDGYSVLPRIVRVIEMLLVPRAEVRGLTLFRCLSNRPAREGTFATRCHFSWNDVQQFNDAEQPRVLSQIRINSDRFLRTIINIERMDPMRASQLLALVAELMRGPRALSVVTGRSRLLLRDVVQQGGFRMYEQHTRLVSALADTTQLLDKSSSTAGVSFLRSRTAVLYGVGVLPVIRALIATVDVCIQRRNDSSCLQGSGFLALGVAMPVSGFLAMRYVPWIIQSWSDTVLELLPASAPTLLRENTMLIGKYGLRFGPKAIGIGLAAIGVAFDLFNIVQVSKMLDVCSTNAAACSDKDEIDLAISLTFSCVSIALTITLLATGVGVMAGVIVGVALMAVEMLLMGINEVLYHKNKYETTVDENFRIFFRRIVWMSPPADVQALERRTDWINALADHGWKLMEAGSDNIVAYAVGIGNVTDKNVIADFSIINMANSSEKNGWDLSRVMPKVHTDQLVPVCLPKRPDFAPYEEISSFVNTAVFGCYNSFVLMHKERSQRGFSDSSTILYELEYVESGYISGSALLNNIYLLGNSSARLNLFGSSKTSNTFVIRSQFFRGSIYIAGSRTVIDCSNVPSKNLEFSWRTVHGQGKLDFKSSRYDSVSVHGQRMLQPNLHFIGRVAKPDTVICDFSQDSNRTYGASSITVDAGGGSKFRSDILYDCKTTIVRPFTLIYGTLSSEVTYTPYVWLSAVGRNRPSNNVVHATIVPVKSMFVVTFVNQPLFYNLINIRFVRSTQSLVWRFMYTMSSVMELAVQGYSSGSSRGVVNGSQNSSGNCIFIDGYSHMIVDPVIESDMDDAEVTRFSALVTINSTELRVVQQQFLTLNSIQPERFAVVTKFVEPKSSTAFLFGAWTNDRFLIDNSTIFSFGGNGNDVYVLERGSPKRVWLSNEASDEQWDVLVLPDSQCKWLTTSRSADEEQFMISITSWDVEIACWESPSAASASLVIVMRGFLLDRQFQHLLVHWNDSTRALLPTNRGEDESVVFATFFSVWGSVSLTLTSGEENLVLNGTSEDNPAVVYRSGSSDIVLTTRFFSGSSSSFVVLKDFFTGSLVSEISLIWKNFQVFLFGEGAETPRVLNASSIQTLALLSELSEDQAVIQEYHVNITDKNTTVVIEHNKNSTYIEEQQLGVLVLYEAEPKDVLSVISDVSLVLWARGTSIYVKNWCLSPLHRLYRIEFMHLRRMTPLILRHLTHLSCTMLNNSMDAEVISELRTKLRSAQQQFELDLGDDEFRLTLCLSSILADTLAQRPMYELFGFSSAVHQAKFIRDNCYVLFTSQSLSTASLRPVKIFLESTMQSFVNKEQSIETIQKDLSRFSDFCWKQFTNSLYNRTYKDFEFIDDIINAVSVCVLN